MPMSFDLAINLFRRHPSRHPRPYWGRLDLKRLGVVWEEPMGARGTPDFFEVA